MYNFEFTNSINLCVHTRADAGHRDSALSFPECDARRAQPASVTGLCFDHSRNGHRNVLRTFLCPFRENYL